MRTLLLIITITVGLIGSAFANQERPRVDRYAKAFTGGEGVEVVLLGVGDKAAKEYLVKVSGINHDWDRIIFKAKKIKLASWREGAGDHAYSIMSAGKAHKLIVVKDGNYQVFLSNSKQGIGVAYNKGFSRRVAPQHLLTDYLDKKKR